jgi:integron integrase
MVAEIGSKGAGRSLFDVAREKMRTRHMAYRTEQSYLQWIRRYVVFHDRRHPRELGPAAVEQFLSYLAVERKVSASTQSQALQALLFLYRHVLEQDLPWLDNVTRATRPRRLPVVLSRAEVAALLAQLQGTHWLVASLLYGGGLRLLEGLRLRVKDVLVERQELIIRDGKGGKDRVTVLPSSLEGPLREHLAALRRWFDQERRRGAPGVSLPMALRAKYPGASQSWGWPCFPGSQSAARRTILAACTNSASLPSPCSCSPAIVRRSRRYRPRRHHPLPISRLRSALIQPIWIRRSARRMISGVM